MIYIVIFSAWMAILLSGGSLPMKQKVDLIVKNGTIYTVDPQNSVAGAMAIHRGKILAVGTQTMISSQYESEKVLDCTGKFIFPGFIDAHCHFYGYALGLQYIDLFGCTSFKEVLERLKRDRRKEPGKWIVGRGWDQNLWEEKIFPDNSLLNELFPDVPVMLIRVDGHVVLANETALKEAGLGISNRYPGQVEIKNGRLTGILSEKAADLMRETVPEVSGEELTGLLKTAEHNCFAVGLTTVGDAGLEFHQVEIVDSMQKSGALKMNIYGMLTPTQQNLKRFVEHGIFLTDRLSIRSVKIYADGSLGSRTARLKKAYSDDPSATGIIVTSPDSIRQLCEIAYRNGYQVNTHCIGDSACSLILKIYGEFLKGKNDLRWRIEHAQVVDPVDLHMFGDYSVIPSVQATHATSDMKWAGDRLGPVRVKGAYAYKDLMRQNGWIANGTDFPIENISPLQTFYAAVARKDLKGYPIEGYQTENSLTREEALRSVTIWAAKANFMEKSKGSLEIGKDADFVILDQDIMQIPTLNVPTTASLQTFIMGEAVHHK